MCRTCEGRNHTSGFTDVPTLCSCGRVVDDAGDSTAVNCCSWASVNPVPNFVKLEYRPAPTVATR